MKEKSTDHQQFLARAIELAKANIEAGGGPFGAVIVKEGKIIAEAANSVTLKNDPTAHAEVEVIRKATQLFDNFQLEGCTLYSSCEPCPMCLGAIYWAGIEKVWFASTRHDAEAAGFSDAHIYREIQTPIESRALPTTQLNTENIGEEFVAWKEFEGKTTY